MSRAVRLTSDGGLAIQGQDLARGVEGVFGTCEYEFERRLSADETTQLRVLLGIPTGGDLFAAIADRFDSTSDLETFAGDHGISGTFWNRMGE